MSDAIVLRALQLREHRILELEDENRRLKARAKAALYEADRESTQRIGEEVARAEAAEAKVARARTIAARWTGSTNPALFMARDLTAALADEVDDSNDESSAQTTGHAGSQEGDR